MAPRRREAEKEDEAHQVHHRFCSFPNPSHRPLCSSRDEGKDPKVPSRNTKGPNPSRRRPALTVL